jgi:uncharacterized membrane protein
MMGVPTSANIDPNPPAMNPTLKNPSAWDRVRNAFFSGLLVLGPAAITIYVVWRLFLFVDHLLGTTLRGGYIRPGGIPGLGFLTVLVIILAVGFLANNILGRQVGTLLESMLMRLPVFRGFYATVKQVGEALLGEKRDAFQRVVLIEYPTPGRYALAFVTASPANGVAQPDGRPLVGVFLPHAPNPTSGFLLFYPEQALIPTSLKVDQALKMVVSGGVVNPGIV